VKPCLQPCNKPLSCSIADPKPAAKGAVEAVNI
jgi:hypothetical protein